MIISFRGYVLGLGRTAVKVADSFVAMAAVHGDLIAIGKTKDEADQYILDGVKEVLESCNE